MSLDFAVDEFKLRCCQVYTSLLASLDFAVDEYKLRHQHTDLKGFYNLLLSDWLGNTWHAFTNASCQITKKIVLSNLSTYLVPMNFF